MAPEKFSGRLFIIKKSGVRVIVFFAVSHLQMEASPTITLPRTTPSKSVDWSWFPPERTITQRLPEWLILNTSLKKQRLFPSKRQSTLSENATMRI